MESSERIIDSIKNWFNNIWSPAKSASINPEIPTPIPGWDYNAFREYVIALTKGRDFLLPIEEYPSRIDLSTPWHEVFNQIRPNSYEGWVLFGYQAGQRRLILPKVAEKGLNHSVPHQIMLAGLERARAKAGISDLVGDAHSHPKSRGQVNNPPPTEDAKFSLGDLYGFLYDLTQQRPSDPNRSMMFVVEGNMTIAAFATRRSLELVRNNLSGGYEDFAKHWYGKYGWTFKGRESEGGGELAEPARPDAPRIWQINKAVAFHYQLALYRGVKNEPLIRDYPARNNS